MNINTHRPARYSPGCQYHVENDETELPQDSHFVVLPGPVEDGDLALIVLREQFLIVGRWRPDLELIVQPKRLIRVTGKIPVRAVGRVVPIELRAGTITDLTEAEREAALRIARGLR
jgi:hypothetical protein